MTALLYPFKYTTELAQGKDYCDTVYTFMLSQKIIGNLTPVPTTNKSVLCDLEAEGKAMISIKDSLAKKVRIGCLRQWSNGLASRPYVK